MICIHCHQKRRAKGLYCVLCWLSAMDRLDEARKRGRRAEPSHFSESSSADRVHRARFDDGTCPCHREEMRYVPTWGRHE